MIDPKELRIGNYVIDGHDIEQVSVRMLQMILEGSAEVDPIPLTPEVLQRLGAIKSSIHNPFFSHYDFYFGRDRHLSVSNPGTPNELVMLLEYNTDGGKITPSIICLRIYDYDGNTYVHHLQNIYYDISNGQELELQPPQLAGL